MNEKAFWREVGWALVQVELIITADSVGYHVRNRACLLLVMLDECHYNNNLQSIVSKKCRDDIMAPTFTLKDDLL